MVVFGEALHSPVQVTQPDWVSGSDYDQHEAVFHRRSLVDRLADSGDLASGIHFADVPFGCVGPNDVGRTRWVPYDLPTPRRIPYRTAHSVAWRSHG